MTQAFAWWSESGGPGKTTNCVHTSAAIGRDGYDVVAVDLDQQRGCMSHHMGYEDLIYGNQEKSIMSVLFGDDSVEDIIVETPHFDLVPGHNSLKNFESEVNNTSLVAIERYKIIRGLLEDLAQGYDIIVLDCQASPGLLMDNAIFAARNIMVPLELTPKGSASQESLKESVEALHEGFIDLNVDIAIAACIPSRVGNAKIFEQYREELESDDLLVSPFSIPEHSLLKYSWKNKMDLFEFMQNDETRDLRQYEEHVPLAFKMIGRMMTGDLTYDEAVDTWDDIKDQRMGDADPEALLNTSSEANV